MQTKFFDKIEFDQTSVDDRESLVSLFIKRQAKYPKTVYFTAIIRNPTRSPRDCIPVFRPPPPCCYCRVTVQLLADYAHRKLHCRVLIVATNLCFLFNFVRDDSFRKPFQHCLECIYRYAGRNPSTQAVITSTHRDRLFSC